MTDWIALAMVGSGCLLGGATWGVFATRRMTGRAVLRSYDAGFEDGRETVLPPQPEIRLIPVPAPRPGPPERVIVADITTPARPYLDYTPYAPRPDIGAGWSHGVIWSPPWELVARLPRESWLRALLAQATAMPPHRILP